jgi:photosystem II stability/assembly factor-like uncharacterized protein
MVALALFLVLDIALVVFALDANRVPSANAGQTPGAPAKPSASPAPSGTPTPTVAPIAVEPQRLLAAISADVAWRGAIGSCPNGPSELEYTTDGGASWDAVDPRNATGANTLVRLIPSSSSEARVVTLDDDCSPQLVGTFVAGEEWEDYTFNLGAYWYVDPADRTNVHTPAGFVAAPCESVVAMATRSSTEAVVLCADQALFTTTDGGAKWSAAISVPGAVAIDASARGYIVAVAAQGTCTGTSVVTLIDGVPSSPVGCMGEPVLAGQTALAAAVDDTLWLWAGESFAQSTDGGETWTQSLV